MHKLLFLLLFFIGISCREEQLSLEESTVCPALYEDFTRHSKHTLYQDLLNRYQQRGLVGVTMLAKDDEGAWTGASGMADLAHYRAMQACDRMPIASISKVFTAVVIFKLIEQNQLTLNSRIEAYLDEDVIERLANTEASRIQHLLSHRSGIPDYYTTQFGLDQFNSNHHLSHFEDLLRYAYGKKALFAVDENYSYSNTNYILLGMVAERVSGQSLAQLYQTFIFEPLNLQSAYFSLAQPIPNDAPKGYIDLYGNDQLVDSELLYIDELRTPDGGIVINSFDLFRFFDALWKGKLLHQQSIAAMRRWFDLPKDAQDEELGHTKNGYGLEYFETAYGDAFGHTGGIDGFRSIALYFPAKDYMYVQIINVSDYDSPLRAELLQESLALLFHE